jgi:hypothetical protein
MGPMGRWNPVVFQRCDCPAGACPSAIRFEPFGRTQVATHVLVHQAPRRVTPVHAHRAPGPGSLLALPLLLLGAAALLLASFDNR